MTAATNPAPDTLPDHLLEIASDVVARARRAGADAAVVNVDRSFASDVGVRMGVLEDVSRAEDGGLAIKLFVGERSATVSGNDVGSDAIDALITRALAMAAAAPPDPLALPVPATNLFAGPMPSLDLCDATQPDAQTLKQMALAAEDAARSVAGVTNSDGGSASASWGAQAMATSEGFAGAFATSAFSTSASVIAGVGESMQRDADWHSARHFADLEDAASVGLRAGERAVARMNPGDMPAGRMPVLFDPRVAGGLIGALAAAMAGPLIARGTSFLLGKEGATLFPSAISVADDPHRRRGMKSRPFDAEGVATRPGKLVDAGVIGQWLLTMASARKLGRVPTAMRAAARRAPATSAWRRA